MVEPLFCQQVYTRGKQDLSLCVWRQVGNLYDLLGKLYADRASSAPAALRARAKKQVRSGT